MADSSLAYYDDDEELLRSKLTAVEKHAPRMLLKSMLDAGASSFGKAFLLYALPMSVLRGELKKTILRRASALAAFMGIAKAVQIYLFQQKNETLRYYSQAVAGGLGATVALAIDSGLGYNTLVIWFAIRAARCLLEENMLGQLFNKLPFMPTTVMCLSAAQILSTWVRYPNELDPGYRKFLDLSGGRPRWVMNSLLAPNRPTPYPLLVLRKPGTDAVGDGIQYFFAGLRRASKLYLPLYMATLLFGLLQTRNHTASRLMKLFLNFGMNVGRSCVFLSAYCTIAWVSWPFLKFIFPGSYSTGGTRVALRRHVWMAGLATLLERKERRPELAAYCATYALDSMWRRLEMSHPIAKRVQPILSAFLLVASCSILLHHYNKQPALVTKWVLGFETQEKREDLDVQEAKRAGKPFSEEEKLASAPPSSFSLDLAASTPTSTSSA